MKILLIYPYFLNPRLHAEEIATVPMGLFYVGAMLKANGYDVEILNWHAAGNSPEMIRETLIDRNPDVIGFSIVHANRWGGIDIARVAKDLNPESTVVFGGIGATFLWEHLLTHFPQVDAVVIGEGEIPFLRLVQSIEAGRSLKEAVDIAGLALRTGQGIVRTAEQPLIEDLDSLPPPARYFDFQHVALTRGCPGRCTFCGSPQFWGRSVRAHSADYFVDQLEMLAARGARFFFVSDDTFTLYPELVAEVCRQIINRGLNIAWQAISKVNAVRAETLHWMRRAGCVQISYGVESGSEAIRRRLCKDISRNKIKKAFEETVAHAMMARAYFIYGAPGETWDTIEETLDLIREIKPLSAIFYILDIFPGTALYEDFKKRTGKTDDVWLERIEDLLYFETDPRSSADDILAFGKHLRESYHRMLPAFAEHIQFEKDDRFASFQADFLSRLGLTFSHGDYARLPVQPAAQQVALDLFQRALRFCPDQRAYWGMTLILQRKGEWEQAGRVLDQGLEHFPDDRQLHISKAVIHMHAGRFSKALEYLLPFETSHEALPYIVQCYRALGDMAAAGRFAMRLKHAAE